VNEFLTRTDFIKNFLEINQLNKRGFKQWAFYPGMLFNSQEKWWGKGGRRKRHHEGIDICLYKNDNGVVNEIGCGAKIPVMYKGEVIHVERDYIGTSVFVKHGERDFDGNSLLSIYGHTDPSDIMKPGTCISEGDIIGCIADTSGRSTTAKPHLHLSVLLVPDLLLREGISWAEVERNCSVVIMDPLKIIDCDYAVIR